MDYQKRPVKIKAIQWTDNNSLEEIEKLSNHNILHKGQSLFIETLEGVMEATKGDYIIRGVQGEIYPCKPDIFAQTYEAI